MPAHAISIAIDARGMQKRTEISVSDSRITVSTASATTEATSAVVATAHRFTFSETVARREDVVQGHNEGACRSGQMPGP